MRCGIQYGGHVLTSGVARPSAGIWKAISELLAGPKLRNEPHSMASVLRRILYNRALPL